MFRALVVASVLVLGVSIHAGTIRVPSERPDIQSAIDAAATGDTVLLETSGSPFVGVGNRDLEVRMKAIVIRSQGGPETAVIDVPAGGEDGSGALTLMWVADTGMRVEGITFRGGMSPAGGAVSVCASHVVFSECVFDGNQGTQGGGLGVWSSSWAKAEDCRFEHNSGRTGGSVYCTSSSLWLERCVFDSNQAEGGFGGGLWADSGSIVWADYCLFVGNQTTERGGGAAINNSDAWFSHCTFMGNVAPFGQHVEYMGASLRRELSNCILAYATGGSRCVRGSGLVISCCDIFGNQEGDWIGVLAPFATINGNMQQQPFFSDRYRGDYTLHRLSPCLPDNNACGELIGALDVGRAGGARVWRCTPEGTSVLPTIQAALDSAILGDTVRLGPGVYSGEGNQNLVFWGKGIALISDSGAASTAIDCAPATGGGESRGFNFAYREDSGVVVRGVTVRGGSAQAGGAVYVTNGASPRISECVLQGNSADSGGAVFIDSGSVTLDLCQLSGNAARLGGAVYVTARTSALIRNCTIVGNIGGDTSGTHGSALDGGWYAVPVIENSIVAFHSPGPVLAIKGCSNLDISCTDMYGNEGGDWLGCLAGLGDANGNSSEDPEFIDTAAGDYRLNVESPCLPEQNSCGVLMGACPAAQPEPTPEIPTHWVLRQNYPNPFNAGTTICYDLAGSGRVCLEVFNTLGQKVRTLFDGALPACEYTSVWDGCDDAGRPVSTGVYLYRLTADDRSQAKKMLLLK